MNTYLHTLHAPRRGWQLIFRRPWLLAMLAVLAFAGLAPRRSQAQLVSTYAFAASAGTFTPLSSGTPVPALLADEGATPVIALGFTFRFDGNDYTSVYANSNGLLSFSPTPNTDYSNDLSAIQSAVDPLAAVLWDDLTGATPGAAATYSVSGAPGSRVFTFEWLNWGWDYNASVANISFQVKLHEGSNQVEYVYRPEAGTLTSPSASVGLRSVGGTGPGSFLSVNTLSPTAVSSTSVSTNTIAAKPAAALRFTFTPTPCSVPPTYATLPVSQSFETPWTDACAAHNAAGASWRTTPLIGDNSWRREDDGTAAAWRSPAGYLPTPVASQGSHAAIFHSAFTPAGVTGNLDLYVNLSAAGTKVLTFDYVNVDQNGSTPDQLDVLLSTDGGQTFGSSLLTLTTANAYGAHTVVIPSTSATSVVRFRGTGDYQNTDIGLDNVQLVATTCAPPTSAAISGITPTTATLSFTSSASATSYTVTYQASGGPVQTVSPNPTSSPVALSGLTPTTAYTVTVLSNCSGGSTSAVVTASFTTSTPAPANDLCSAAPLLTAGNTCTPVTGTLGGAQAELSDGKLDVWYKFVATDTEQRLVITNTTGSTATFSSEVYAGSCPGNSTPTTYYNTPFMVGLTVGQTYYVRIYDFYNAPLTPTTGGFSICLTKPYTPAPANDLCTAPQSLTPATTCVTTTGTLGGTHITPGLDLNDDVWYSFVASNTQHSITVLATGTATPVTEVYSVGCPTSSTTPLAHNASSSTTALTGLTPGTTYYVRVYEFYSSAASLSPAAGAFTICVFGAPNNLIVTNGQNLTNVQGTYDNVTVQTGGSATLAGGLVVNQTITVQTGGILNTNCQLISGAASFTLNAGGTLGICNAQGIYTSGASGTVQVTGGRSFSSDALYVYNGSVPQSSGPGLPAQVRELTVVNAGNGLTLNNTGLDISRVLRLTNGNFLTSSLPVRLLSSNGGTALIDNTGGLVTGTVQVQRYVNNTLNAGLGYRHLSSPVAGAPVSQLGSGGSPIVTNPLFNAASATVRPTIVPYPTVFSYDESQVPAGGSTTQAFDQGYQSPASGSSIMGTSQGYTVQVGGGQTLSFSGPQNNGAASVNGLGYGSAGTQAGWHLLGNPYPSPLDWSTLSVGTTASDNLQNLSGAVYVFQSSGQYAGTYRTYQNGQGGDPIIASGQAFFVRTAGVGQSGTFRTSNANRVTTWSATNSTLYRGGNDPRPRLTLALSSPGSPADATTVYTEAGATPAVDARYDAYKLRNPGAASFYSLAGPDELTINGLPLLSTADVAVPLGFSLLAAGPCVLHLDDLTNFPATTGVLLRDNVLGTLTDLRQQPTYAFTAPAGSLASTTRFALVLRPSGALATHAGLQASQVAVYPNPAHQSATLLLPAVADAPTATAVLLDALGRTLWQRTLPVGPAGSSTLLDLRSLPTGVYMLRLQAGTSAPVTKRLTVE